MKYQQSWSDCFFWLALYKMQIRAIRSVIKTALFAGLYTTKKHEAIVVCSLWRLEIIIYETSMENVAICAALPLEIARPPVVLGFNHARGQLRGLITHHSLLDFSKIGQSAAELLIIRQILLLRFTCCLWNHSFSDTSGRNYTKFGEDIAQSSALVKFF